MLLSRYNPFVMELDMLLGIKLIEKAYEKQLDEKLFEMWNLNRLFMTEKNFETFEEFRDKAIQTKESTREVKHEKEDIINKAERIIAAWKR
ncbi:hypothetical protein [Clostridium acetobutylicum]|uniref:Uncharacterized protein n=3 Tax=Clostridiaceae TaxID=31979 RepID=Q97MY1_CLOAB|nr:hypothetical protein [Clostridium acetobutylicum]PSM05177.1 hypothetical protein C7T89_17755 [Clostridium sp. NJ4]AAK78045.1 Hypothetical protein CA_C0059 [Clostridium acetobutylicum ATCC 824]AEI31041.1 hypothetical protein SMB_G0059 [Clostridium acetobutylicum DSM 1731]AWV81892.1 hypothetical protein DK921_17760 [Clostridium acetobutylicum]MBC2395442.1 hypothetical protein [Clostridium acetobutylicum]